MYIDSSTYRIKGKTYRRVLLRNSYRVNGVVKHDTIANLSKCSESDIALLKKSLQLAKRNQSAEYSAFQLKQGLSIGAIWTLHQLAQEIGLVESLGNTREAKLTLWMVYARLLGKGSRLSTVRLMQKHAGCDILDLSSFNEEDLYETLDWLQREQSGIEDALFKRKYLETIPTFYLYDVTSSYLEGDENELADYGYNRDKKKGTKQIVIGLMTDAEGWPITVEVFKGNTNDAKTVKSQITKIADRFCVKEVTFVGDRGMLKRAQIEDLKDEDFHYITAITKQEIESLIKKEELTLSLFDTQVAEVTIDGIRYVYRKNPQRAKELEQIREQKLERLQKLCDEKNSYLNSHKKAKPETACKTLLAKAKTLNIAAWADIQQKDGLLTLAIDIKQKEKESRLDGCYVLKTDRSKELSAEKVHSRYKDLADVEFAFKTMKTTFLEMRGIFVRKENRTRSHVFIVMLSYMLSYRLRRLWKDVDLTIEEGLEELGSINAMEVHYPHLSYQTIPEPRPMSLLLLQKAGVSLPDAIPCKGASALTKKGCIVK